MKVEIGWNWYYIHISNLDIENDLCLPKGSFCKHFVANINHAILAFDVE